MPKLDEYIYARTRTALERIPDDERADIYVVSLFVYDENDDPRRPTITVGYNTESAVKQGLTDTDEGEARWNFAYFLQNELDLVFDSNSDPEGAELRTKAITAAGYDFPGDDASATEVTTPWFVANTVFAARRLHDHGDIEQIFGRSIPILVHELEYYDVIAMQNLAANPPGVADDFVTWCRGL